LFWSLSLHPSDIHFENMGTHASARAQDNNQRLRNASIVWGLGSLCFIPHLPEFGAEEPWFHTPSKDLHIFENMGTHVIASA
jgi:hypothetical protein